AADDLDAGLRHVAELHGVVLAAEDRLGEVLADLLLVDVDGGHELDVPDVVAAQVDVHQAGDLLGLRSVLVVLDALHERGGAVADADDGDAHLAIGRTSGLAVGGAHLYWSLSPENLYDCSSCIWLRTCLVRCATVTADRIASSPMPQGSTPS